jgi:hypothetical protein
MLEVSGESKAPQFFGNIGSEAQILLPQYQTSSAFEYFQQ